MTRTPFVAAVSLVVLGATSAAAQTPAPEAAPDQPPSAANTYTLGGYVEALYQWNFNNPENGITHYRGFDNRHNTFTLSNIAVDASWDYANIVGRLTLQVGATPSTYYLAEPTAAGAAGANASDQALWKYVQQAFAGYRFDYGGGLTLTAGVFLSPIGPESMAVRDNWNWSRSNQFFGLPFYHTGARATYAGFEPNRLGTSAWAAGPLYGRFKVSERLLFALRADIFYEHVGEGSAGKASTIFWPAPWVSSGTATIDYRPHERVSFRLEYRHDQAGADMYFRGRVVGDGDRLPYVMDSLSQDTLTLGATTWF